MSEKICGRVDGGGKNCKLNPAHECEHIFTSRRCVMCEKEFAPLDYCLCSDPGQDKEIESLRADLEKTRGELGKEKELREDSQSYVRLLRIELAELHSNGQMYNPIRKLFGIPVLDYLPFLDGIKMQNQDPDKVLSKLSAQAKELEERRATANRMGENLSRAYGNLDKQKDEIAELRESADFHKKRADLIFHESEKEKKSLEAHNAESMGINTELAADNAKLRERVKSLGDGFYGGLAAELTIKNESLQEENSALLAQNGELRDALQGLQWPEKGWDSMAALDLAERRGREALSRTPTQSLAELRAGVREEEWEAFECLASGGVAQGFTMVRFLQSIKDARTRAAKAKSLTEKP